MPTPMRSPFPRFFRGDRHSPTGVRLLAGRLAIDANKLDLAALGPAGPKEPARRFAAIQGQLAAWAE